MNDVTKRLLQAMRFERDAFVWMDFSDRATGDALILVAVTRVLILLGTGSSLFALTTSVNGVELLVRAMINAAFFWIIYSGLVYAIGRYLLEGGGSYATTLRIAGFAYPTLLLLIASIRIIDNWFLALLLGSAWFLAIVERGIHHTADLTHEKATVATIGGLVGFIILSQIFRLGF